MSVLLYYYWHFPLRIDPGSQMTYPVTASNTYVYTRKSTTLFSMQKLFTVLTPLAAGLILGWFAHMHYKSEPLKQQAAPHLPVEHTVVSATKSTTKSDSPLNVFEHIRQLLLRSAYIEAVEQYELLQASNVTSHIEQARNQILEYAQQLVNAGNYVAASQLLQRFIVASYRDSEARMLLAETYSSQQDYLAAIEQLYELRGIAFRPEMLERIKQRIHHAAYKQAELYRSNGDNTGLLSLFQNLTQKEPDHASWFIELAIAQLAVDDNEAAQYSLALVISDPEVGEQAQTMLNKLQDNISARQNTDTIPQAYDIAGIPLTRIGHNFLVDASSSNNTHLQLLIDTGASITILTPDVLQQGLHYQDTGKTRVFATANGTVRAPIYILESLNVGDWQVEQLEVGVLELKGMDGLLGMNFLKHFRFFIDQHAYRLRLSPN